MRYAIAIGALLVLAVVAAAWRAEEAVDRLAVAQCYAGERSPAMCLYQIGAFEDMPIPEDAKARARHQLEQR